MTIETAATQKRHAPKVLARQEVGRISPQTEYIFRQKRKTLDKVKGNKGNIGEVEELNFLDELGICVSLETYARATSLTVSGRNFLLIAHYLLNATKIPVIEETEFDNDGKPTTHRRPIDRLTSLTMSTEKMFKDAYPFEPELTLKEKDKIHSDLSNSGIFAGNHEAFRKEEARLIAATIKKKIANRKREFYRKLPTVLDEAKSFLNHVVHKKGMFANVSIIAGIYLSEKKELIRIDFYSAYGMLSQATAKPFFDHPVLYEMTEKQDTAHRILVHILHEASMHRYEKNFNVRMETLLDACIDIPTESDVRDRHSGRYDLHIIKPILKWINFLRDRGVFTYSFADRYGQEVRNAAELCITDFKHLRLVITMTGTIGAYIGENLVSKEDRGEERRLVADEKLIEINHKRERAKKATAARNRGKASANNPKNTIKQKKTPSVPPTPRRDETMDV